MNVTYHNGELTLRVGRWHYGLDGTLPDGRPVAPTMLRVAIQQAGLTQQAAADALGLRVGSFTKKLAGTRPVWPRDILALLAITKTEEEER